MKFHAVLHRFYPDGKQCWPTMVNDEVVWVGRPKEDDESVVDVPDARMLERPDGWLVIASLFSVDGELGIHPKYLTRRVKIPYKTVTGRPRTTDELAVDIEYWLKHTAPKEMRAVVELLLADRSQEAALACDACKDLPECVECADE